jgi:hypothetical protein
MNLPHAFTIDNDLNNKFTIIITEVVTSYINTSITGSYKVLCARLFGLEYHDYLRMARDIYGAQLHGKQFQYLNYSFENKTDAVKLMNELNKRWSALTPS